MISAVLLFFKGIPAWVWQVLVVLALLAGIFFYGAHWQAKRDAVKYQALQTEFTAFKAKVAAEGEAAKVKAKAQEQVDKQAKEKADEDHKTAVAALTADIASLRRASTRGRTVPPAPTTSSRPDLACFDRALLGEAVDGFLGDVSNQVAAGAAATVDLNNARAWAQSLKESP